MSTVAELLILAGSALQAAGRAMAGPAQDDFVSWRFLVKFTTLDKKDNSALNKTRRVRVKWVGGEKRYSLRDVFAWREEVTYRQDPALQAVLANFLTSGGSEPVEGSLPVFDGSSKESAGRIQKKPCGNNGG